MKQYIILGIGTGRCGTGSLARVLNQQPDAVCSYDEPPLLPWKRSDDGQRMLRERFARFRLHAAKGILGDVARFYLPYVEDAIAVEPDVRIVCLRRPREEVVMASRIARRACDRVAQGCRTAATLGCKCRRLRKPQRGFTAARHATQPLQG